MQQSTEAEMVQLFRTHDELCEQRQELENKLDEAEDIQLPWVEHKKVIAAHKYIHILAACMATISPLIQSDVGLSYFS